MISKKIEDEKTKDCRCECGSLIARMTPEGVELKCRRCKRIKIIPFSGFELEKIEARG